MSSKNYLGAKILITMIKQDYGYFEFFSSRIMATRTLILYYNWFVNSFILYGLGLNWQALTGSLFTNFMIGA